MKIKLLILIFIVLGALTSVSAQSFSYSYTDPCTGITKSITVPSNGVTVSYYGQVNTFAPGDFYSGAFETWTNTVYASFGGVNPCASVVGMPTATNVAQSTAINFIGQVNSLSAIADLSSSLSAVGGTNMLGGVAGSASNSSGNGGDNKSNNKNNNGSNNNNSGSGTSGANNNNSGSTSSNGSNGGSQGQEGSQGSSETSQGTNGSSGSGGTGTGSESGGSGSGSGEGAGTSGSGSTTSGSGSGSGSSSGSSGSGTGTGTQTTETSSSEGGGKTNVLGGSVSSVGGSSGTGGGSGGSKGAAATAKNGNRPSILASSDFVGFNFKNSDVTFGSKVTGGYTAMRWDGKRASGITADYTSALKGPNFTGFYANIAKKRIDLISGTVTLGFDKQRSAYGTLALGQMWTLGKKKKAKAVYMLTGSWGNVYGTPFVGTAVITGGMYDLKIGKRIDIKLMGLYVYAPYVSYYNDILLKSPHVVLPIVGTNIGVTKRFKININGGGAWAIGESTLNYTVMMGTRLLL